MDLLPSAIPLCLDTVPAGFPSPAIDYTYVPLDLNKHLIKHPAATFLVKSSGDSMLNAGIFPGDILIVDRSITAKDGMVVVACLAGDFTVKRLKLVGSRMLLMAENPKYDPIEVQRYQDEFSVWGVVTYVLHNPN